jgi:hypothetical protein
VGLLSRYEVDFSCPTHICKPLAWDAAKLFTESGNHSHASGDGKIQPPPREHVCFWAHDRRCPLITERGGEIFKIGGCNTLLNAEGHILAIPGTVRPSPGANHPSGCLDLCVTRLSNQVLVSNCLMSWIVMDRRFLRHYLARSCLIDRY